MSFKIKCPNCGFTIAETDIICPLCENVTTKNKSDNIPRKKVTNMQRPKTNRIIIMLLANLVSIGFCMFALLLSIEQRQAEYNYYLNGRLIIILIIIGLNLGILLDAPFNVPIQGNPKKVVDETILRKNRKTYLKYYFILICVSIFFWHLCLRKIDLFYLDISYARNGLEYLIKPMHRLHSIIYHIGVLCWYVPYLIYYYFNLNFEYEDTKQYLFFLTLINVILIFIFFLCNPLQ